MKIDIDVVAIIVAIISAITSFITMRVTVKFLEASVKEMKQDFKDQRAKIEGDFKNMGAKLGKIDGRVIRVEGMLEARK